MIRRGMEKDGKDNDSQSIVLVSIILCMVRVSDIITVSYTTGGACV